MRWKVSASSTSQFAAPVKIEMPALLTSASMRPQRATAACDQRPAVGVLGHVARTSSVSAPASRQAACDASASASLRE